LPELVRVDFSDGNQAEAWDRYILAHPEAQYTDRAAWRGVFRTLYGFRDYSWLYMHAGVIRGALSVYYIRSPFLGCQLVSSPFFGTGGLCTSDPEAEQALMSELFETAEKLKVDLVELRLRRPVDGAEGCDTAFCEFDLPIEATEESLWDDRLSSNVRQNLRKAMKLDLSTALTSNPIPAYEVVSHAIRDLGTPFHARRFFETVAEALGPDAMFSEVREGDAVVAAGLVIRFRDTLSTPYIGSVRSRGHTRANYLQYWELLRHGIETNARRLEFGRSPRGSTHEQFKRKWGATPVSVYHSYWLRSGVRYRSLADPPRLFRIAADLYRHTPLFFARRFGHWMARYVF
jgi:FemAB-related protein (PEP-CTERM system-associated)